MVRIDPTRYSIHDKFGDPSKPNPVGLAENPPGVPFQCGTCSFLSGNIEVLQDWPEDNICTNEEARLYLVPVNKQLWCCDKYNHPGMRVIIP